MIFRVETTAQAERDGEAILDWLLAQQAGDSGIRWFLALEEAIASLATLPKRCPIAPENEHFSLRSSTVALRSKPHVYRILFTIDKDTVYVLHIRHGRRQRVGVN
jgi:plasmid stabilization system protein ParE